MRRREVFAVLAGGPVIPLTARAQPSGRIRRIGVLLNLSENDPET